MMCNYSIFKGLFLADQIFYRSCVHRQHFRLRSFASSCFTILKLWCEKGRDKVLSNCEKMPKRLVVYKNTFDMIKILALVRKISVPKCFPEFDKRTPLGRKTKGLKNAGLRQLFSNSSQNSSATQQKWSYFYKGRKNRTLWKFVAWSCFSLSRGLHEKYNLRMIVASRNSIEMTLQSSIYRSIKR